LFAHPLPPCWPPENRVAHTDCTFHRFLDVVACLLPRRAGPHVCSVFVGPPAGPAFSIFWFRFFVRCPMVPSPVRAIPKTPIAMIDFSFPLLRRLGLTPAMAQSLTTFTWSDPASGAATTARWMRATAIHRETVDVHDGEAAHSARCSTRLIRDLQPTTRNWPVATGCRARTTPTVSYGCMPASPR
jgi:hypothetical protein